MGSVTENPFKGLRSYEQKDSGKLFGRDKDLVLMKDRIFSSKTTLLFAGSGVGKTSFLNAKVIPALSRSFLVFYHNEWAAKGEPLVAIKTALREKLNLDKDEISKPLFSILERFREPEVSDQADEADEEATSRCLLIFDQFEEIFQYHSYEDYFRNFIDELCEVINAEKLQARLVFSMREEFLGELSVFDNRVPGLFNNYYRLKYPDKLEAEDIIANTSGLAGVEVDEKNLAGLVSDLSKIEKGAAGFAERSSNEAGSKTRVIERDFIVPPYLQIACHGLWERQLGTEQNGGRQPDAFLSDYKPNEAHGMLRDFCNKKLSSLSFGEQFVAARAFNFLVTKQGAKMAYEMTRLSEHMIVTKKKLQQTLEKLSSPDTRILRESRGPDGSRWFELYHDMYGTIVDDWKHRVISRMTWTGAAAFFLLKHRLISRKGWRVVTASLVFLYFLIIYFLPHWVYNPSDYIKTLETETVKYEDAQSAYLKLQDTFGYKGKAVSLWARYWERRAIQEELQQNRDKALLCWLQALKADPDGEAASKRRLEAGRLTGADYQSVIATFRYSSRTSRPLISADGSAVLTKDADESISLWNCNTGDPIIQQLSLDMTQLETPRGKSDTPQASASSATLKAVVRHDRFKFLIAGDNGDNLFIWRADTGKKFSELNISKASSGYSALAFSPDGRYLAAGGTDNKLQVWRLSDTGATPEKQITQKNEAKDFAFSPDGKRLITTDGKAIRLWNLESPSERVKIIPLTKAAFYIDFSPDGKTFLVRYEDGSVQVWLAASGQPTGMVIKPYNSDPKTDSALGPDGRTVLISRRDGRIESWDSQTGKSIGVSEKLTADPIIFHPDGQNALTIHAAGMARMIRVETRIPEKGIIKVDDNILVSDLSSDGKIITALSSAEKVQLWSADTLDPIGAPLNLSASLAKRPAETDGEITPPLAFSSDGEFVIKIEPGFVMKIWQVSTGKQISDKQIPGIEFLRRTRPSFTFSPDGRFLVITDRYYRMYSSLLDTYRVTPVENVTPIYDIASFAFSPKSKYFAFVTPEFELYVRNLSEQSEVSLNKADLPAGPINVLVFGGDRLITSTDNTAQVWDLTTGNLVSRIKERKGNTISAIALSPDLKQVLTGSETGVVSLWDITNREAQMLGNSADLNNFVSKIKFSDDGTAFVVFANSWVYLFSIESDGIHHRASRLLGNTSGERFIMWDGARPTIRLVSQITTDRLKVDDLDFSERGIVPLDGEPSELWAQWEQKCALTIDKNGDLVPLYQSSNAKPVEEKDSDR